MWDAWTFSLLFLQHEHAVVEDQYSPDPAEALKPPPGMIPAYEPFKDPPQPAPPRPCITPADDEPTS